MPVSHYVGQIMPVAFNYAPIGWAQCDGRLLNIKDYPELHNVIGNTYGGSLTSGTFGVPDLRGRAILGADTNLPVGTSGGSHEVELTADELPFHRHVIQASSHVVTTRNEVDPTNKYFAGTADTNREKIFIQTGFGETTLANNTNMQQTGGRASHNNMQPFLAINYVIALSTVVEQQLA